MRKIKQSEHTTKKESSEISYSNVKFRLNRTMALKAGEALLVPLSLGSLDEEVG
jgi:hypothetical protein